ncbi:TetR/AcrR family transcriptional regulator [Phycicoccus sonneratiae]|uniref:TetR/AcrR family transcriptional regulator n=1 Tax=Phycicoccus sonneratiae TaxID=2807628 RepID=A0ABS2CJB9_9MICO|nr:TetR/AcrR family transcriptional regulator [Phycicoccus sonneraticus]MBM6399979.1 TetR/AcrR family transcriptional regulator [Phycicoccus sonneraticus]
MTARGPATGRRGAAVRAGVLRSALELLADSGYASLSMEAVAERAGVHKTTVYRRWSNREALVTDAVLEGSSTEFGIPDTGDIDADLRDGVRALARWLDGPVGRPLVAMLASDAGRLPAVQSAKRRFFAERAAVASDRVAAAVAAGQLPAGTDPTALLSTLVAPLYLNLLVTSAPVTDHDCDRAAAVALTAARAGLLGPAP